MKPKHRKVKLICTVVALSLCLHLASCGFILYPERRGQTHGRIDPAIAVLDGVGLLLFLVPGIVAFAVDFATGTIYLPGSKRASTTSSGPVDMLLIHVNPDELNRQKIERIVSDNTGHPLSFNQENVEAYALERTENFEAQLTELVLFWNHVTQGDMMAHQQTF